MRLVGRIVEQPTVLSLFFGMPVVMARSEYAGLTETRGIDFRVQLENGEVVRCRRAKRTWSAAGDGFAGSRPVTPWASASARRDRAWCRRSGNR